MEFTQNVIIKDRKSVIADSVTDIECFADDILVLNTKFGKMCIEGHNLKILGLTENDSKISVTGDITGVFFSDENEKRGIFKRMFK